MPGASGEVTPPLQIALAFLLSLLKATGAGLLVLEHLTWRKRKCRDPPFFHRVCAQVTSVGFSAVRFVGHAMVTAQLW